MLSSLFPHPVLMTGLMVAMCAPMVRAAPTESIPIPVSEDYILRTWDSNDGLPSNRIWGITQTPDGYLWLATPCGLARFDGERFTPFTEESTPEMEVNDMGAVFTASNGDLWLGFDRGGVVRMHENRFEQIVPFQPITSPADWISSFAEDASGGIWFGRQSLGVASRWMNGRLTDFRGDGLRPGYFPFVHADAGGRIWYSTRDTCGIFDGTRLQTIGPNDGGGIVLAAARNGGMWAARGNRLLRYRADGSCETMADLSPIRGAGSVMMMLEDGAGNLWLATRSVGLVRWRDGSFVKVPTSQNDMTCVAIDREDNLWAGSWGGGMDRVSPRHFYLHKADQGSSNDSITSICEDKDGNLWLAPLSGAPMFAKEAGELTFSKLPGWGSGRMNGTVRSMCADPAGGVWIACWFGAGLLHWQNGMLRAESLREDLASIITDRQGDLWVATLHGGLVCHRHGRDTTMSTADGLVKVRALAEDAAGRLWAGTEGGLVFQRQQDRFIAVPLPMTKPGWPVRFIVPDENDTVWIGTLEGGLYRWQGGKIARLPYDAGLPTNDLSSLLIDPDGYFWFGTGKGLFRVSRTDLDACIDGRRTSVQATRFGRNEGLPSMEFSLGYMKATARTRDGNLWFATSRGALEIRPHGLRDTKPLLPPLIEEVRVGEALLTPDDSHHFTLPPMPRPLQIHFTLPQFSSPERICFRYRLIGLGADAWVSAGNLRTAIFSHLPPGDYQFELVAADTGGAWSSAVATVRLTVRAAWWQTGAFRGGAMILGVLTLAWSVRKIVLRRARARMRRMGQQHALERERTRIARDMHDELGASLTQIAITSKLLKLDPLEAVAGHSDEIAAITRRTVEALDEIVWAVNPSNDTLPMLFEYIGQFAVDFLASAGIACEVDMPAVLPARLLSAHLRHQLFLVVKEAVHNIVKHAGASTVRLTVEATADTLRVVVADNGHGFETGHERAGADGLRNMRGRMTELGGSCRIESSPGTGARVILELPFPAGGA